MTTTLGNINIYGENGEQADRAEIMIISDEAKMVSGSTITVRSKEMNIDLSGNDTYIEAIKDIIFDNESAVVNLSSVNANIEATTGSLIFKGLENKISLTEEGTLIKAGERISLLGDNVINLDGMGASIIADSGNIELGDSEIEMSSTSASIIAGGAISIGSATISMSGEGAKIEAKGGDISIYNNADIEISSANAYMVAESSITISNVDLKNGAEFIVVKAGKIVTMPGLPKKPAAEKIDITDDGFITGLF